MGKEPITMCCKLVQGRLARMNSKLPLGLREEQRVQKLWKKGQTTQEDYKNVIKLIMTQKREKTRKLKVQLEVNLATGIEVT